MEQQTPAKPVMNQNHDPIVRIRRSAKTGACRQNLRRFILVSEPKLAHNFIKRPNAYGTLS
jgi:hypothetical protein